MYTLTIDQQVDVAFKAWMQVVKAKEVLWKKVKKIEKGIESAELGEEFELLYLEKRMVLTQYDALTRLSTDRWDQYYELVNKREIEDALLGAAE